MHSVINDCNNQLQTLEVEKLQTLKLQTLEKSLEWEKDKRSRN